MIGQGSSIEGTSKTHGAPLGAEEVRATKERLGMDPDAHFAVPEQSTAAFRDHDGAAARVRRRRTGRREEEVTEGRDIETFRGRRLYPPRARGVESGQSQQESRNFDFAFCEHT